jgi:hypothetical protein
VYVCGGVGVEGEHGNMRGVGNQVLIEVFPKKIEIAILMFVDYRDQVGIFCLGKGYRSAIKGFFAIATLHAAVYAPFHQKFAGKTGIAVQLIAQELILGVLTKKEHFRF